LTHEIVLFKVGFVTVVEGATTVGVGVGVGLGCEIATSIDGLE